MCASIVAELDKQCRPTQIPFTRLEWVRVSLAKREVGGNDKQAALTPGYGRINNWCGSLDFELENGTYSMGYISRRDYVCRHRRRIVVLKSYVRTKPLWDDNVASYAPNNLRANTDCISRRPSIIR